MGQDRAQGVLRLTEEFRCVPSAAGLARVLGHLVAHREGFRRAAGGTARRVGMSGPTDKEMLQDFGYDLYIYGGEEGLKPFEDVAKELGYA